MCHGARPPAKGEATFVGNFRRDDPVGTWQISPGLFDSNGLWGNDKGGSELPKGQKKSPLTDAFMASVGNLGDP